MERTASLPLDRRSFLALLAGALGAAAVSGCRTLKDATGGPPDSRLAAIVEVLLPRTATPGGLDCAVPECVARLLAGPLPGAAAAVVAEGLEALDAACRAQGGRTFAALPAPERARLLGWIDAAAFDPADRDGAALRSFWLTVKQLVVVAHFTSRAAVEAQLLYDPLPGEWQADVPRTPTDRVSYTDRTGVPYLVTIPL